MKTEKERRKHKRKTFNKYLIFFCTRRTHWGVVVNLSRGGAFIKINGTFSLGELIKFSVPGSKKHNNSVVKGWIVRICPGGVGVSFERRSGLERRSDLDRRTGLERRRRKIDNLSQQRINS